MSREEREGAMARREPRFRRPLDALNPDVAVSATADREVTWRVVESGMPTRERFLTIPPPVSFRCVGRCDRRAPRLGSMAVCSEKTVV